MKGLKEKTEKDLIGLLKEKAVALRSFRFGASGSKSRNVREGRGLRKEIAQILTTLNITKK